MLNVLNSLSTLLLKKNAVITNVTKTFAMLCTNIVLKPIIQQPIVTKWRIALRIAVGNATNIQKHLKNVMQRCAMQCSMLAFIPMLPSVNTELMKLQIVVTTAWIVLGLHYPVDLNTIIVSPIFALTSMAFALKLTMTLIAVAMLQLKFLIAAVQLATCAQIVKSRLQLKNVMKRCAMQC